MSWAISPIGLVLSVVGLFMYRSRGAGRGLAIAGVVLGVFGIIMCIVYTASFAHAVSSPSPSVSSAAPAPVQSAPGSSSAVQQATGSYGTPLTAGNLTVTAAAPTQVSSNLGPQLCSTVTYRNTGSTSESYNMFDWKVRTATGADTSPGIAWDSGKALNSGDLQPGGTVSGQVCADNTVKTASAMVYSPGLGIMHQLTWQ